MGARKLLEISEEKYYRLPGDSKGVYSDFDGETPDWKGKRTIIMGCISPEQGHSLGIEGVHFNITGSYTPSTWDQHLSAKN